MITVGPPSRAFIAAKEARLDMQEGMDKPSLLCMACALTIVGPRQEIASLGWGEAHSVECEYVLRDFRRDDSTWLGYIGDEPRFGAPGPEREPR